MSDKTFGVKVNEELFEKVKSMIEVSGNTSKEWFEKAVTLMDVQSLKAGSGDYKQDLTELELHTTRIYELIANMIKRAEYLKGDAVQELETKLESRDLTITELQAMVKKLTEERQQFEDAAKQLEIEKKEISEQVDGLRSANDNNQALIQEYKEKIDTLSSLVNEYKGYAKENTELKTQHAAEKEQMKAAFKEKENRLISSNEELKNSTRDLLATNEQLQAKLDKLPGEHMAAIESLKENYTNQLAQLTDKKDSEIKFLKENHVNQLTQLADKKDLEKERAILEIERINQAKLEKSHEQYNEKLSRLYEKFELKQPQPKKQND